MSFNSTVLPQTISHPTAAELYSAAGTDFDALNTLEKWWVQWYIYFGDPIIATGLLSFTLHEIVYFGRCIPWIIIDAIPYFRKWKLQPNKVPSPKEQWECTKLVLLSHFTIELPGIWLFHPLTEFFGMRTWQAPFPHWTTIGLQVAGFFVFEDFYHFVAHQALHYGPLYRHIHKLHHKYSAPFGLAAEYAHPLETLILALGTLGGPILWTMYSGDFHIVTMYLWVTLRLFQAIDAHSGYDFPWSLQHILPFWSGADHHDFHHMAFTNNYSTSFRWWDHLFGTDDKYRAYKAKLKVAKSQGKDVRKLEQELLEQTEKEGMIAEKVAEQKQIWANGSSKVKVH
ncbi:C-4 sterol methyl oxidase [Serendipita sp. 411]|nr:C-4 sterol methyl oxidase [Serendipita sp. 411]